MNDMQDREQWLNVASELIRGEIFDTAGLPPFQHPYRIACGFPKGGRKTIGMAFPRRLSADQTNEIYITPEISAPVKVLGVLTHELLHALDDCQHGHRGPFALWARKVGLEGKLTATKPGELLTAKLSDIAQACGEYPHGKLTITKKDSIRQLKCECHACTAIWRMSAKWTANVTCCPCCGSPHVVTNV